MFLLGGLAVQMTADLGFGPRELGAAIAVFSLASAVAAAPGGRVAETLGARRVILGGVAIEALTVLAIGVGAHTWTQLVALLVVGGVANGMVQPAANLVLSRGVPPVHLGLAFGLKQASIPAASLLAGLAVPLIGLTVGWRWAFVAGALPGLALVASRPRVLVGPSGMAQSSPPGTLPVAGGPLRLLAVAAGCGTSAATGAAAFLVSSVVDRGMDPGSAGLLLAVGSIFGIIARVVNGATADRKQRDELVASAALLLLGAVGLLLLAVERANIPLTVLGAALTFGAGWGWQGLFNSAIVRRHPYAPARATGITQTGVFLGGVIGPLVFGSVASSASFAVAWLLMAALALVASGFMLGGRVLLTGDERGAGR